MSAKRRSSAGVIGRSGGGGGGGGGKGCLRCARGCLLASSILFLIIGDVMVGAGIYFFLYDQNPAVQELNRALPTEFLALRVGLLVAGAAIVLVSFCACVGVVLSSRCALLLYLTLSSILAIACSTAAIVSVSVPSLAAGVRSGASLRLKRCYGNASLATIAVDYVQTRFECCGWQLEAASIAASNGGGVGGSGSSSCDWFSDTAWHSDGAPACPQSCCSSAAASAGASDSCSSAKAHKQSCSKVLQNYLIAVPLALAAAVILMFTHLICAFIVVLKQKSRELITAI